LGKGIEPCTDEIQELDEQNNNEAAEKYFVGNAQYLKQMEMVENSLRENAKIVITEHGISPTLSLGSLPVRLSNFPGLR
jgi:hypothetical protein